MKKGTWLRWPLRIPGGLLGLFTYGAIVHDGPAGPAASASNFALAIAWAILTLALTWRWGWKAFLTGLAVALIPWSLKGPSNDRDWQPEFAKTGWVDQEGDLLTFHNTRNFDYDDRGDAKERWETRQFHLSKLQGLDYFHCDFGGDYVAHPILSFDFGGEGRLCLSIETRRERSEEFSLFGGLYKMFELQYIFGTETDFVRVRTQFRGEPMYVYHTRALPKGAKNMLLKSIGTQNALKEHPRFYNVISSNCTTSLLTQIPVQNRPALDHRMLLNGMFDQYLDERGFLVNGGLDFAALRKRNFINPGKEGRGPTDQYSERVRKGKAGF